MQTLNLINKEKSDVKYTISRFPDGEVQIALGEVDRKQRVAVKCRITSAEDLFILTQVNDILTRQGVVWTLDIFYLMGMRMDRVMDFSRPYTLSVVANCIHSFSCRSIMVLEPHSEVTLDLLKAEELDVKLPKYITFGSAEFWDKYNLVIPDKGAYERLHNRLPMSCNPVICEKKRDISTGRIISIEVTNPKAVLDASRSLIVVDDLCDGGGTFCGIAEAIRKIRPDVRLEIYVTHMVNQKGVENLAKMYDHVYFTNSYKDWNTFKAEYGKVVPLLPENVTQIDVV